MDIIEFQDQTRRGVTLVHFSAAWCPPCRAQKPVLKDLLDKYQQKVRMMELNIDENRKPATQYMVHSIPTLIVFREGNEFGRLVGLQSETEISGMLDRALQGLVPIDKYYRYKDIPESTVT